MRRGKYYRVCEKVQPCTGITKDVRRELELSCAGVRINVKGNK